jgi:uncharacterized membrane protein
MGLFSEQEQERIREAVAAAERSTSGEIRICVESHCKSTAFDRAVHFFNKLGMANTKLRNGVLIYLAVEDHQFAIIGDSGINAKVPENFWDSTKELMRSYFKKGDISGGIVAGIAEAGQQLKTYFPSQDGDVNELNNDIAFGEED